LPRLLVATRNAGKLRELQPLLAGTGIELETLAEHPEVPEVAETGETFEANASLKAAHAARASGLWSLGEDSGLEVDALAGAPGVHSARYAGGHGDDAANNRKLLEALRAVERRTARYVCAMALARPGGEIACELRASCEGTILEAPRGEGGFGYDPLFVADGQTRSMAELAPDEKAALSHRGRAARKLEPDLRAQLAGG
jgi:XTP/dITP diphosphohydrolase